MGKEWQSEASRFICMKTGVPNPVLAIRSAVRSLLDDPIHIPTDLDAIARRLNVGAIVREPLPFDGALVRHSGKLTIKLNSQADPRRRRFTLAHELTHILLTNETSGRSFKGREVERLCNIGAGELLMPETLVRSFFKMHDISPASIRKFATEFDVSLQASAQRAIDLRLTRGAFLLLKREEQFYFSQLWRVGAARLEVPIYLPQLEESLEAAQFSAHRVPLVTFDGRGLDADITAMRLGSSPSFLVLISPPAATVSSTA